MDFQNRQYSIAKRGKTFSLGKAIPLPHPFFQNDASELLKDITLVVCVFMPRFIPLFQQFGKLRVTMPLGRFRHPWLTRPPTSVS